MIYFEIAQKGDKFGYEDILNMVKDPHSEVRQATSLVLSKIASNEKMLKAFAGWFNAGDKWLADQLLQDGSLQLNGGAISEVPSEGTDVEELGITGKVSVMDPPESQRQYSTRWDSRVKNPKAHKNQWMQIDLGSERSVVGVATKARARCDCTGGQRVTAYEVAHSKDGSTWTMIKQTF